MLGELLEDADGVERLERVALQGDAVADAAERRAQFGDHHLHAALGEGQGQHTTGDAATDDEDAGGHFNSFTTTESDELGGAGAGNPPDDVVRFGLSHGDVGDLAAAVEDHHPIGDLGAQRKVMGDEHDRDTL